MAESQSLLPLADWTNQALAGLSTDSGLMALLGGAVEALTQAADQGLARGPWWLAPLLLSLPALGRRRWGLALFVGAAFGLVESLGLGAAMRSSLVQVLVATGLCLLAGVPLGIAAGAWQGLGKLARPLLDVMQTMPAFVYLIPAVMLFGLGVVPAVLATVIFAIVPVVRMTANGIRSVEQDVLEAARILGARETQVLWKIRIPYALPMILAGVNQTIMMALSMVVVASMVGGGGLGGEVLSGIQRLDMGQGFCGGLAVVMLAMTLDRISECLVPRLGPA